MAAISMAESSESIASQYREAKAAWQRSGAGGMKMACGASISKPGGISGNSRNGESIIAMKSWQMASAASASKINARHHGGISVTAAAKKRSMAGETRWRISMAKQPYLMAWRNM